MPVARLFTIPIAFSPTPHVSKNIFMSNIVFS